MYRTKISFFITNILETFPNNFCRALIRFSTPFQNAINSLVNMFSCVARVTKFILILILMVLFYSAAL